MAEESQEKLEHSQEIREFQIGEVSVTQRGRVSRLEHHSFGTTYLIDVTDREDPTIKESDDQNSHGKLVSEMLKEDLGDPKNHDRYASNNGVIALITNRLDQEKRLKMYLGMEMVDPEDEEAKEITAHVLNAAGFEQKSFYVPFSFDVGQVRRNMFAEMVEALEDFAQKGLISDSKKDFP